MIEKILTAVIILTAVVLLVRYSYKVLTGKKKCSCAECPKDCFKD